jgi:hypothetical protein
MNAFVKGRWEAEPSRQRSSAQETRDDGLETPSGDGGLETPPLEWHFHPANQRLAHATAVVVAIVLAPLIILPCFFH